MNVVQFFYQVINTPIITDINPKTETNNDAKLRGIAALIESRSSRSEVLFFLAFATLYILNNNPINPNTDSKAPPQIRISIMEVHYVLKRMLRATITETLRYLQLESKAFRKKGIYHE